MHPWIFIINCGTDEIQEKEDLRKEKKEEEKMKQEKKGQGKQEDKKKEKRDHDEQIEDNTRMIWEINGQ